MKVIRYAVEGRLEVMTDCPGVKFNVTELVHTIGDEKTADPDGKTNTSPSCADDAAISMSVWLRDGTLIVAALIIISDEMNTTRNVRLMHIRNRLVALAPVLPRIVVAEYAIMEPFAQGSAKA